jgi:hypothetical protein
METQTESRGKCCCLTVTRGNTRLCMGMLSAFRERFSSLAFSNFFWRTLSRKFYFSRRKEISSLSLHIFVPTLLSIARLSSVLWTLTCFVRYTWHKQAAPCCAHLTVVCSWACDRWTRRSVPLIQKHTIGHVPSPSHPVSYNPATYINVIVSCSPCVCSPLDFVAKGK